MKNNIKNRVYYFMVNTETKDLNTNDFIIEFYKYEGWIIDISRIKNWASVESITRARRYWLEHRPDLVKRSDESRDNPEKYKEEFKKVPVWIY